MSVMSVSFSYVRVCRRRPVTKASASEWAAGIITLVCHTFGLPAVSNPRGRQIADRISYSYPSEICV